MGKIINFQYSDRLSSFIEDNARMINHIYKVVKAYNTIKNCKNDEIHGIRITDIPVDKEDANNYNFKSDFDYFEWNENTQKLDIEKYVSTEELITIYSNLKKFKEIESDQHGNSVIRQYFWNKDRTPSERVTELKQLTGYSWSELRRYYNSLFDRIPSKRIYLADVKKEYLATLSPKQIADYINEYISSNYSNVYNDPIMNDYIAGYMPREFFCMNGCEVKIFFVPENINIHRYEIIHGNYHTDMFHYDNRKNKDKKTHTINIVLKQSDTLKYLDYNSRFNADVSELYQKRVANN